MAVLRVNRLSMNEAGDLIARLWYLLEKLDIASPRVSVEGRADDSVDIGLIFAQEEDAERLRPGISALGAIPTQGAALRADMD